MNQFEKSNRRLLCRDGPKLEMSNCTRTDRCGNLTAMVTSSSSTARSLANASAETVEPATAAKPESSSGNVRNDCLTVSTWLPMVPSAQRMSFRNQFPLRVPRSVTASPKDQPGSSAMTGISNSVECECERIRSSILCRVWVSPKRFWM